ATLLEREKKQVEIAEKQAKGEPLTCTYKGRVSSSEGLIVTMHVKVESPLESVESLTNEATIQGGGAPPVPANTTPITVSAAETPFAVRHFAMTLEGEGGTTV